MKHIPLFILILLIVAILSPVKISAQPQKFGNQTLPANTSTAVEQQEQSAGKDIWEIGNISATFSDPERNNRNIPTEIFYPADIGGSNAAVAEGVFPLIVFGHGFAMNYNAYQYLWEALVPYGYILAFPKTEASIIPFPDHADFGLDMAFLVAEVKALGLEEGSAFYGKVSANAAVMGHSMGGGAAFLAAADNEDVAAVVTFAPAETDPSAIDAAALAKGSVLIFAGENDCVTPVAEHQLPMFNNPPEGKKILITIIGGGHCYFGDYNFFCSLGENSCSPDPAISRAEQQQTTLSLLIPFLEFQLKGEYAGWEGFQVELTNQDVQTENGWTELPVLVSVQLEPGWNSFSFSNQPVDRTFAYLVEDMGENLLYFSDGSDVGFTGQNIPTNYFPDTEAGYFLKVSDSVAMEFAAWPREETALMLDTGWQLLPVLSATSVSIGNLFRQGSPQYEIIKAVAGVEVNWPEKSVSSLQVLHPNRAYRIKMLEAGEIVFP
jgi:dienelactone hydrolase